ncbi:MAG TPA: ATP-binding protein [Steroidobacter sp.]|jgi:two-component system sensor histidine kinase PilS (NtrC family)|nr:ATP-binding protein [Steroidobacteraceae bacterium]HLS80006.1 ATP-binding protein [Steroidobacter sp.]
MALLARGPAEASVDLEWRVLALINLFRLLTPLLLGVLFATIQPAPIGGAHPPLFIGAAISYFLYAALTINNIKQRWPDLTVQALVNACVDVLCIALMTYASGGVASGLGALLVLPIGAAAFVVRRRMALVFAALGTLALLIQQTFWALAHRSDAGDFTSAGIIGALIFIVALGVGPLAENLKESEERVRQREVDVANLAELNQFIVQHLRESIIVVDRSDNIRLINASAAQLLQGSAIEAGTQLGEVSPRLLYLLDAWRKRPQGVAQDAPSLLSADGGSLLQPHFVALNTASAEGPTLIFLEDTSLLAERVQQSKLAALGRLSASIAHEIRNPVGAMSHAAQLLAETPTLTPQERRLTNIISSNGDRVSTIIDNVLQLSRRDSTRPERLELNAWLQEFLGEFRQTMQVGGELELRPEVAEVEVRVDPSHLHQLLWNLCENALKYGRSVDSNEPIELRTGRVAASDRPVLEVLDRGPGIAAADAERIFEPFFTGGRGGTGLGLFLARELAQCNGAVLVYEPRAGGGSVFRMVFADPQRWEA